MNTQPLRILVTGGAGFIGSALVRHLLTETPHTVLNLDKLTYAGNLASLAAVEGKNRYSFLHADVCDHQAVAEALRGFRPDVITHLAAESHVDRSIDGPAAFVETNIVGTSVLLTHALDYWRGLEEPAKSRFRFHLISTDEVFGSLGEEGFFTETTAYDPRSPYSASKAAADHLVRAWRHTFGLPTLITNCSNNYGPYHFPEKLIPLMIIKGLADEGLPVYGSGGQVRDWLHVEDHVRALTSVFERGEPGETYIIGGRSERRNLEVVHAICDALDRLAPVVGGPSRRELVRHVADRPGHDQRYAIDPTKIERELGWSASVRFEVGIENTVRWYMANEGWWRPILEGNYTGERLGLKTPA